MASLLMRKLTPLAGGYFACIWILKGDLDYIASDIALNHYASNNPCALCQANTTDKAWTDTRMVGNLWEPTMWGNAT